LCGGGNALTSGAVHQHQTTIPEMMPTIKVSSSTGSPKADSDHIET
jgi:hypothetical protein